MKSVCLTPSTHLWMKEHSAYSAEQAEGAITCYRYSGTLQVLHSRGNHWIVASTLGCSAGEVSVFDSLYPSVDEGTLSLLKQLFGVHIKVKMESCPKQAGVSDCGLFNCTTLAYGGHPNSARFNQDAMRQHLLNCLESFYFIPFPKSE